MTAIKSTAVPRGRGDGVVGKETPEDETAGEEECSSHGGDSSSWLNGEGLKEEGPENIVVQVISRVDRS